MTDAQNAARPVVPEPAPTNEYLEDEASFLIEDRRENQHCPCGNQIIREGKVVMAHWAGKVCQECEATMFEKNRLRVAAPSVPVESEPTDWLRKKTSQLIADHAEAWQIAGTWAPRSDFDTRGEVEGEHYRNEAEAASRTLIGHVEQLNIIADQAVEIIQDCRKALGLPKGTPLTETVAKLAPLAGDSNSAGESGTWLDAFASRSSQSVESATWIDPAEIDAPVASPSPSSPPVPVESEPPTSMTDFTPRSTESPRCPNPNCEDGSVRGTMVGCSVCDAAGQGPAIRKRALRRPIQVDVNPEKFYDAVMQGPDIDAPPAGDPEHFISTESLEAVPRNPELEKLLDEFEKAGIERSIARNAFHSGEGWVDDGHASYPTESYLLAADANARTARSAVVALFARSEQEVERLRGEMETVALAVRVADEEQDLKLISKPFRRGTY